MFALADPRLSAALRRKGEPVTALAVLRPEHCQLGAGPEVLIATAERTLLRVSRDFVQAEPLQVGPADRPPSPRPRQVFVTLYGE